MTILRTIARDALRRAAEKLGLEVVEPQFLADMRTNHAKALDDVRRALATIDGLNKIIADNMTELVACQNALDAAGTEQTSQAFPDDSQVKLGLGQRVALALQCPVERDFAWALEQVHSGLTVTHPCVSRPGRNGHLKQTGTLTKGSESTPVYELDLGGCYYSSVMVDSSTWTDFAHKAQKTHGWEIVPEPEKKA